MKVLITDQALKSLSFIIEFNLDKRSLSSLKQLGNTLITSAKSLSTHPFRGQKEEYLVHLDMGHRRIIEGQYKIIYRIDEKNEIVYVTDMFDTRQDPSKMKG